MKPVFCILYEIFHRRTNQPTNKQTNTDIQETRQTERERERESDRSQEKGKEKTPESEMRNAMMDMSSSYVSSTFFSFFSSNSSSSSSGNVAAMIITFCICFISIGWMLLLFTSASLLLPNTESAKYRRKYATTISFTGAFTREERRLQLQILMHLLATYCVILPTIAYLWIFDELFYSVYRSIPIVKPVITISLPRAGTTSFHRILSLDDRFVTPNMIELVLPFVCLQKLLHTLNARYPHFVQQVETFLKYVNGVTQDVEARHPVGLFLPDADDILLGEYHWTSVGSIRTCPIPYDNYWYNQYKMQDRSSMKRSLLFHQRVCQKILYNRGTSYNSSDCHMTDQTQQQSNRKKRLLLRSHLSPCIDEFQTMYPDATIVGIVRDPIDILRSFSGLSKSVIYAASNGLVDMVPEMTTAEDAVTREQLNFLHIKKQTTSDTMFLTATSSSSSDSSSSVATSSFVGRDEDDDTYRNPWSQLFVKILNDMMHNEAKLYIESDDNDDESSDIHSINNWKGRCHYVTFPDFKSDPLEAMRTVYEQIDDENFTMTEQFQNAIRNDLMDHETYKQRHAYRNPTLESMGIAKEDYLNLPGVKLYSKLFVNEKKDPK